MRYIKVIGVVMLNLNGNIKIYLATGHTDMRKGVHSLSHLAGSVLSEDFCTGALFVFRGKRSDRLKILWYDGQGFCMYYKLLDQGKFTWPKSEGCKSVSITSAQLYMLLEGIDWRTPVWSTPPEYIG